MTFKNDAVKDINLSDKVIEFIKEHKMAITSTFMAVSLSVTLMGCTPATNEQEEIVDNQNTEQTTAEEVENALTNEQKETSETTADKKSAVITSVNLAKESAEKLKDMKETATSSQEYQEGLKQSVAEFDALYRMIVKGENYQGITFEDLSTAEKIDTIDSTMSIGEIIETVEPNHKEDIETKKQEIYSSYKDFIDKYGPKIREKVVSGGAWIYNKGKEAASEAKDIWSDIKEEANKQR